MKNRLNFPQETEKSRTRGIPDLNVIDLDTEEAGHFEDDDSFAGEEADAGEWTDNEGQLPQRKKFRLNIHLVLLTLTLLVIAAAVYRFLNWGEFVDQEEIFRDGPGEYSDTLDQFLPLTDENGKAVPLDYSDGLSILIFGNNPFSDDKDSEDSLAHMIADLTDATVYDCSVSGSFMASEWPYFSVEDRPMDAYTPYWLVTLATTGANDEYYAKAAAALGENTPPEAEDVYQILTSIDLNTVDVIVFMYDATDYLMSHLMYNDDNSTDITCFTGNLEASIEMVQSFCPHIRIIVMSPAYAFGVNEKGEYVSSDIQTYGQHFLSTYVIKESVSCSSRGVTFVDHLYGTITEDNASEYLTDNLHLNPAGRRLIAQRFVDALTYFDGR